MISGDFDNQGTVMAGFYDYVSPITDGSSLEVTKTYKQSSNAKLQIAFSSDDSGANTKFKAGVFDIASGAKLEFVPIHTAQKLITTGIINIKNDSSMQAIINNFDSNVVDMTNTNLLDFYLNNDKTKIAAVNKGKENPFKITPPTDPDSAQGSGTSSSSSGGSASQGAGNQNQNNQAEQIAAQQTAGQQAVATLAAVPPSSPDAPIKALQGLLNNAATLSPNSTAALAQLDNLPSAQFSDALNAMKNTPTNTNIDSIDTMQKDLTIKNALFLMDPASSLGSLNTSSSVFAPTAAFGDEYLGKVDDVFIKTELSAGIAYRHTDHDDYKQNSYLLDLQAKKALSDSTLLGGFIGLSNSKTEDDLSDTRSNMFSLGLSLNHNFDSFGVLLGASAGMSFNRYEQSIKYLSNAKNDANYKNYFANFQGGVYKSFKLSENLNLTPIALLDYSVIRQDSFSQSGALAKNYEAKTTHFSRGWLGANLVYNTELNNNWRFNTSLFAFYWKKFNHKDINQNLSFVEASDQKFLANTSRSEKQGFYGGIALGASKGNKFFRISLSDEKARAYNQYEIMLRAGLSF